MARLADEHQAGIQFSVSEPTRPSLMNIIAHTCAGSALVRITDQADAYAASTGLFVDESPAVVSRSCIVLLLFLGLPAALCGQNQKEQWSDLTRLKTGKKIEVIESKMQRHAGEFVSVSDELLTLQEGWMVSLKREDIVRVSTASGDKRGEHALIGLVAGAAAGAAAGGSKSSWMLFNTPGIGALVGIAIGGPSGAVVGAAIPAHTTVYRSAPRVNAGSSKAPEH